MSEERLRALREKHPHFRYRGFSYLKDQESVLHISYSFLLEPNIEFFPQLSFRCGDNLSAGALDTLVFNLGLIEAVSYWKAACPRIIIVEAGSLSKAQIEFWKDLYQHGLGEFFFKNQIDFSSSDFFEFEAVSGKTFQAVESMKTSGDLVLVAGGKDSALMLELMKQAPDSRSVPFLLNATRAGIESVACAGAISSLSAVRSIDPTLLKLNAEGYLNGHTPFSAYLAFLGTLVAATHGLKHVIVANESSANEENTIFHGMAVNHQYSKGLRFERLFRDYSDSFLTPSTHYFSFLRPLHEIQIAMLFSKCRSHHSSFRSCNAERNLGTWCGRCAKCAFVYLSLSPFLSQEELTSIFGGPLFESEAILSHCAELLGVSGQKPFECVGTVEESRAAAAAFLQKTREENRKPPEGLVRLMSNLPLDTAHYTRRFNELLHDWNEEHFLPPDYENLLRRELKTALGAK